MNWWLVILGVHQVVVAHLFFKCYVVYTLLCFLSGPVMYVLVTFSLFDSFWCRVVEAGFLQFLSAR